MVNNPLTKLFRGSRGGNPPPSSPPTGVPISLRRGHSQPAHQNPAKLLFNKIKARFSRREHTVKATLRLDPTSNPSYETPRLDFSSPFDPDSQLSVAETCLVLASLPRVDRQGPFPPSWRPYPIPADELAFERNAPIISAPLPSSRILTPEANRIRENRPTPSHLDTPLTAVDFTFDPALSPSTAASTPASAIFHPFKVTPVIHPTPTTSQPSTITNSLLASGITSGAAPTIHPLPGLLATIKHLTRQERDNLRVQLDTLDAEEENALKPIKGRATALTKDIEATTAWWMTPPNAEDRSPTPTPSPVKLTNPLLACRLSSASTIRPLKVSKTTFASIDTNATPPVGQDPQEDDLLIANTRRNDRPYSSVLNINISLVEGFDDVMNLADDWIEELAKFAPAISPNSSPLLQSINTDEWKVMFAELMTPTAPLRINPREVRPNLADVRATTVSFARELATSRLQGFTLTRESRSVEKPAHTLRPVEQAPQYLACDLQCTF